MFKLFSAFLFVFFIFSCSDLEINKIECNGDTDKCPENSICAGNQCFECPDGTIKTTSNTCLYKNAPNCSMDDSKHKVENNITCNNNLGSCMESNSQYICLYDECRPDNSYCSDKNKVCVFDGLHYQCKEKNPEGNTVGETCNSNSDCQTYLSCNTKDKKCVHYCRPDSQYKYNDNCLGLCTDLKNVPILNTSAEIKAIGYGVVGICDYK